MHPEYIPNKLEKELDLTILLVIEINIENINLNLDLNPRISNLPYVITITVPKNYVIWQTQSGDQSQLR